MMALTLLLATGVFKIESEYSHKIWFRENDPYLLELDQFERNFGNDETIMLIVEPKSDLFSNDSISMVKELTDLMWKTPHVVRVDSMTNYTHVSGSLDELKVSSLIPESERITSAESLEIKKQAQELDDLVGPMIAKDMTSTIIIAKMAPVERPVIEYNQSLKFLSEQMAKYSKERVSLKIGGTVPLNVAFRNTSTHDLELILPLVLAILVVLIFFIFKSWKISLFILAEMTLVILATMGFAGHVGIKFSMLISMVPCIVAAIALADSIHIVTTYRNEKSKTKIEAIKYSIGKNFNPTIFTSVTTFVGFVGLMSTDLQPIAQLGTLAAFGVVYAWFTSLFLVSPLVALFLPEIKASSPMSLEKSHRYVEFLDRHKKMILGLTLLIVGFSVHLTLKNKVNSNIIRYFDEKVPVRQANEFLKKHFGGYSGVQIVVDSGRAEGIHDPSFLLKTQSLIQKLEKLDNVTRVSSLIDIIEKIHKAIDTQSQTFIPNSKEQVAQELLLYELGLPVGKNLNTWMSLNRQLLRVDVLWSVEDSFKAVHAIDDMREIIKDSGLKAEVTGKAALITGLDRYIVKTFSTSILGALAMVAVMMIIIFKSIRIGLFSLVPNIIPPALGLGILALMGEPIDIGVVLITSITLGIAVDDTIYFLTQYAQEMKDSGQQIKLSLEKVLMKSTAGLIHTSVILILSFLVFLIGDFAPNRHFGFLIAIVLFLALLCDLCLLPALLLLRKKPVSKG